MPDPIYLDHAATTPVRPEVVQAMQPFYGPRFGNPSSTHRWGREARVALDEARERVGTCLGASPDEICFTSGGTEADNLAILGGWRVLKASGRTAIVSTPVEHKAVIESVHRAATEGAVERMLPVDGAGRVKLDEARALIGSDTALCSVMWINNEIGTIQPVPELAAIARERGAVFHTDAVQAFGKVEIDAKKVPFDLLAISGHKIGAPKGVGAMFVRRGTSLEPLFFGGSQDRGRRPGTENVAYAVGFAMACTLAVAERVTQGERLRALRDRLEARILSQVPDAVIHARGAERAPHISNISVPGTDAESMLMALDLHGVACSGGSACQSGSTAASHVLAAIGARADIAGAAIRMSLGALSTDEGIERAAEIFSKLARKARGMAA